MRDENGSVGAEVKLVWGDIKAGRGRYNGEYLQGAELPVPSPAAGDIDVVEPANLNEDAQRVKEIATLRLEL